jgi:hypothetical protein
MRLYRVRLGAGGRPSGGGCLVRGFIVDTACPHERSKSLGGTAKGY